MEDFMKNKRNKVGYGLLSLALALSLPLNASATENNNKTEEITEPSIVEETTEEPKLIEETEIDTSTTETPQAPAQVAPVTNPTNTQPLPQAEGHNYISQKGKENENKEKPFKVIVHDENNKEGRLKKESDGVNNHFTLNYGLGIEGNGQEKEYTISIFTLKDSKIESLNLKNYIADSKATSDGEKMEKETSKIENENYKGFTIKTKIANTGSLEFDYKFEEEAEAGDYSVYYLIEMDGEKILGKIDVKLEKTPENDDFFVSKDEVVKDYANTNEEKVNPFENLPFAKYLLNDTEEDKNLTDFVNPKQAEDGKVLKITYIDPASDEEKVEIIANAEEYKIPAYSLVKLEVADKEEAKDLIDPSEVKKDGEKDKEADKGDSKEENPKSDEKGEADKDDTDYSKYSDEEKELIDLTKVLNKQAGEIEGLIKEVEKEADGETAKESDKEQAKGEGKEEATPVVLKDSKLTEEQLKAVMANVDKLLAEKKRSVLEINPQYDESEAEIVGLSMMLRESTAQIEGLIQQALLDHELDSLEELEKTNPDQAKEEYKNLAKLLKEAEETTDKANEKLIELDEINLVDNNTDPLLRAKKGEKAVLNLGKLTPITKIEDLTSDSPAASEKDFSKNLEQKLAKAVKKVETVTLTKEDDAKAKANKEEKNQEKTEDPNKKIIVVDKKDKEQNKTTNKSLSLPVFERYLKRVKGQK